MPEPGSKRYDIRRTHKRKQAEDSGVPDQYANEAAKEDLAEEEGWRARGPRTERGRGPKSERTEQRPETD
ncbi:hypothetical protein [Streptomyces aidingensis]|uniref:Uncharacterized protein n=1 Tax=Streptomyces aidingensis TaxID=910347 RepID=A0A1I1L5M3_9ACTN|nr:hypothetical protein [Streptomyces aidingensis]SFC68354.1 hypothetical protein SAMN05421773_10564 [Streptomyces aidingensis]